MTGEICEPLSFRAFSDREAVLEIGWWNSLVGADFDADGIVTVSDLIQFIGFFGELCE